MLRQWEYITEALKNLKSSSKVVNAAQELDNILVSLKLDYNTPHWIDYVSNNEYQNEDWDSLYDIVNSTIYFSACCDICGESKNCSNCLLSEGIRGSCTPRSKYADDYYRIVMNYVSDKYYRN
jgi:hypothetical protein